MDSRIKTGFSHRMKFAATIVASLAAICGIAAQAFAAPTYVGANLPWIAYGHSFGPDGLHGYASSYNATTAQAAFDDMKAKHLNIVRVFLFDDLEGVIANGNTSTIITPSSTYISDLTDFVTRANADGITVYATLFNAWDFVTYPSTYKINPTTIFGNSALYSASGPLQTVAKALAGKNVIWDFLNEGNNMAQYYSGGWTDLAGWVNMNSWISQTKAALRAGGATGNLTISINDPNVLLYNTGTSNSADLLNRNNLDFYDCHFYNDSGSIGISTSTFGDGKPVYVGEFGPSSQDWATTGDNKPGLVDSFWSTAGTNGISGLLIWSYLDDGSGNGTQGTTELTELATKAGAGSGVSIPAAPTGLAASAGNAQVTLSWSASSGATSYNVYRGTSSGGEGGTVLASGITSTSYVNTGLTNGTAYYYKVVAVNSAGTSAQSTEISATPTSGGSGGSGSGPVTFTATAPTNAQYYSQEELAASVPAGTTVTACVVTITDQLKSGDTYGNEWTNGGNFTLAHSTGASTITYSFTLSSGSLSTGQQWWAQVNSNQQQPVAGDTYSVTYTANGTQYTATGKF